MLLFFQIFFTVLSAICVGAVVPLGMWLGWIWAGIAVLGAILCYVFMLLCKQTRALRGEIPIEEPSKTEKTEETENAETSEETETADDSDKKE